MSQDGIRPDIAVFPTVSLVDYRPDDALLKKALDLDTPGKEAQLVQHLQQRLARAGLAPERRQ